MPLEWLLNYAKILGPTLLILGWLVATFKPYRYPTTTKGQK